MLLFPLPLGYTMPKNPEELKTVLITSRSGQKNEESIYNWAKLEGCSLQARRRNKTLDVRGGSKEGEKEKLRFLKPQHTCKSSRKVNRMDQLTTKKDWIYIL